MASASRLDEMSAFLNCAECMTLWAKYGAAITERRQARTRSEHEAAEARIEAACEAMRLHEAVAHRKSRAAGSSEES